MYNVVHYQRFVQRFKRISLSPSGFSKLQNDNNQRTKQWKLIGIIIMISLVH